MFAPNYFGKKLIVVGNGMTGFKFCQKLVEKSLNRLFQIVVVGQEPVVAYDRVHLTDYYTGTPADELSLAPREWYHNAGIDLITAQTVVSIQRNAQTVTLQNGTVLEYDTLVLATGSAPFVPPISGTDLQGVLVYRTLADIDAIKNQVGHAQKGAVIGGGLLGLEAAKALMDDGIATTVIERAPWLMGRQLDEAGGKLLQAKLESQGLAVLPGAITRCFSGDDRVRTIQFDNGPDLDVDLIVVSAGIKPRDELARDAGLEVGKMGGIVVDAHMQTSDSRIFAIGECALAQGMIWGLVAPCYQMAEVLVELMAGQTASFEGADMSTKLKLIGTDVASFGDATGQAEGCIPVIVHNVFAGTYKRLNISASGKELLGGILVGDASDYNMLHQIYKSKLKLPPNPEVLLYSSKSGGGMEFSILDLPDEASICSCENVSKGRILAAVKEFDLAQVSGIKLHTKAGTGCGGCVPMLDDLLTAHLKSQGKEVRKTICEHFQYTRQDLFDLIKIGGITTFKQLIAQHGNGYGCEICKPLCASLFASIWNEPIVKHDVIQDTNDRFLANIQRGGTYSVVPRIPGGEITPQKLQTIGRVASKYDLYTKITGGQRIDLFGARVDQLPLIWEELIEAGFESGHAYGKALRTVKSCVGSTWCRFGLHDSVSFAIEIEERYKGIRAPHKIKGGVSGCIRECAEARGKDFGIIATDKGWNLYVCGNGGANPVHAVLLAADTDRQTCIRYLDRFLMYYIRTSGPLTRTSKWLAALDGGIEHLRQVVVDDSLGLAAQFEQEMQALVDSFKCEWKEVVTNPQLRRKFQAFVNTEEPDTQIEFIGLRNQKMPAHWVK